MIIAVGFKVNSERAAQFRKWVNQIAKDYTIKGWVMDDGRLKRGTYLTEKYFDEQLERIREIRASERKFCQKITNRYATAVLLRAEPSRIYIVHLSSIDFYARCFLISAKLIYMMTWFFTLRKLVKSERVMSMKDFEYATDINFDEVFDAVV